MITRLMSTVDVLAALEESRVVLVTVNDAGVITHTHNGTGPVNFDELDELRL